MVHPLSQSSRQRKQIRLSHYVSQRLFFGLPLSFNTFSVNRYAILCVMHAFLLATWLNMEVYNLPWFNMFGRKEICFIRFFAICFQMCLYVISWILTKLEMLFWIVSSKSLAFFYFFHSDCDVALRFVASEFFSAICLYRSSQFLVWLCFSYVVFSTRFLFLSTY